MRVGVFTSCAMSPATFASPTSEAVDAAVHRLWAIFGQKVRDSRRARRWTTTLLALKAGVSRTTIYTIERGQQVSLEAAVRVALALGLRPELDLIDPRQRAARAERWQDPVHSFMGEFEAGHLRKLSLPVALDEPYQHFHFAGRADLVAWNIATCALLHIENRTRFPTSRKWPAATTPSGRTSAA